MIKPHGIVRATITEELLQKVSQRDGIHPLISTPQTNVNPSLRVTVKSVRVNLC